MAFNKEAARNGPIRWHLDAVLAEIDQNRNARIMKAAAEDPRLTMDESFRLRKWFEARNGSEDGMNRKCNPLNRKAWDASMETSPAHEDPYNQEGICEFYNVLWIERRDGVGYRRACGWVPKYIWEAHATGPVEVKLG
jgi:hypothetical protein